MILSVQFVQSSADSALIGKLCFICPKSVTYSILPWVKMWENKSFCLTGNAEMTINKGQVHLNAKRTLACENFVSQVRNRRLSGAESEARYRSAKRESRATRMLFSTMSLRRLQKYINSCIIWPSLLDNPLPANPFSLFCLSREEDWQQWIAFQAVFNSLDEFKLNTSEHSFLTRARCRVLAVLWRLSVMETSTASAPGRFM